MLIVADNLQFSSPRLARAVLNRDPGPIVAVAEDCVAHGADYLDLNLGPLIKAGRGDVAFILETLGRHTALPLVLDTPRPDMMAEGLAVSDRIAMLNGFSLEPRKLETILPLAVAHNLPVVGFLLRPDGHVPADTEERMEVAALLVDAYLDRGGDPTHLIIDPLLPPLSWQEGLSQARQVLQTIELLPELLGWPVRTMLGISNLTSGDAPRAKKVALQSAFLAMAFSRGLDFALMNGSYVETVQVLEAVRILSKETIFAWESIRG